MIKREKYLIKISSAFQTVPIVVLIGARQVGKTSLMKSIETDAKSLFLNGQDPEVAGLFEKLSTLETYLKVYLEPNLDALLLIDEFQFIHGVSTMLKLLTDKYPDLKILCSGSSSIDILQKVEESLAGRVRTIEVLSLSFEEYLLFQDEKIFNLYNSLDINTQNSALTTSIENLYQEYLLFGGLPRAALTQARSEKMEILNDIYKTYLLRDVRSFIANQDFVGFNKLLRILASQIGNLMNINEISRVVALPYRKCEEYISLLEQMYIIKTIEPYFTNKRKVIGKMKKVYFCDLGLRNCIEENFNDLEYRTDKGAVFENAVMLELWRNKNSGGKLQFYRTSDGVEIDFVVNKLNDIFAAECKYKMLSKPISIASFTNFCESENIQKRYIFNQNLNTEFKEFKHIQGFFAGKI